MSEISSQANSAAAPARPAPGPDLCAPTAGAGAVGTRTKLLVLGGLFLAANYWQLPLLVSKWLHDDNWTHGFVIPLFSVYLIYSRWGELRAAPRRVCGWGLAIMAGAILLTVAAYYPIRTYWFAHVGMIALLLGLVLYQAGPAVVRVTWLPILFPIFAMPLPPRVYTRIAYPLQELAARAAAAILHLVGVIVEVKASTLRILGDSGNWYDLSVAEKCSGMRALMAFVALGVAMAWLEDRPLWQRLVMVALAVPIAVASNCLRVAVTCWMYAIEEPQWGQDFMEGFVGMLMLIPAFLMFALVGRILSRLVVEVPETEPPAVVAGAGGEGKTP